MSKKLALCFNLCLLLLLLGCSSEKGQSTAETNEAGQVILTVSAASSLTDVLTEMAEKFKEENPNIELQFNFGASGTLKQQIEQGAPADVFISAAEDKYNELVKKKLVQEGTNIVKNELVLIASINSDSTFKEFSDLSTDNVEKIAIGTPEVVPAGTYGQQALVYYGVWEELSEQIVYAKDVRQVLSYVETGNVDAGIVYKTDALTSDKVQIMATASEDSHDSITYPFGVVKASDHIEEAALFSEYLQSLQAKDLFTKYGFIVE